MTNWNDYLSFVVCFEDELSLRSLQFLLIIPKFWAKGAFLVTYLTDWTRSGSIEDLAVFSYAYDPACLETLRVFFVEFLTLMFVKDLTALS